MPWTDRFWRPIKLSDGRRLVTLQDARDMIVTLPAAKQAETHWQHAGASLERSEPDHALTAVLRALKVDGLL